MVINVEKRVKYIGIVILTLLIFGMSSREVQASGGTKIHFISLCSTTDAILLESNGHYGMVDSGEDWDYPDGETYLLRDGVTKEFGFEQQVIHYLRKLGVKKLDFYIASHAHSDHIGSGDEILKNFPTGRLYINEYSDEYISSEEHFWDNQYVYDCLIQAAREKGTQIITDLDLPENEEYRTFSMGDMQIEIMNYERERDEEGNILPVPDENCNTLVAKVTAFDKVALLTGDIDPWAGDMEEYGDTAKIANQLIEQLWTEDVEENDQDWEIPEIELEEDYNITDHEEYNGVALAQQDEEALNRQTLDESRPNKGKRISLDLLKMSHHAINYNNTTYFLTSLNPKTVVVTGYESFYNAREKDCMPDAQMFATATDSAAVVADFSEEGVYTEYVKMSPGWMRYEGEFYYFDENGRPFTDMRSHVINGKEYCFNKKGAIETTDRWVQVDYGWKYWHADKRCFAVSEWLDIEDGRYYCDSEGWMVTGWQEIKGSTYYFEKTGEMKCDQWINGHYVDDEGKWIKEYSTAKWCLSGNLWWYQYGNGDYISGQWSMIDGVYYYFDSDGWMVTGWKKIGDNWYYFSPNGSIVTNTWIGDCYVNDKGIWDEKYEESRWINSGGYWWYRHEDGTYTQSGFELIDEEWYYFDSDGWMVTGWRNIAYYWYYFRSNGMMAKDTWIDGYYLDESGAWIVEKKPSYWIESRGRWWYRHGDGSYTRSDFEEIDGEYYYFDKDGWMVTGWQNISGDWYFFSDNGVMQAGVWVGEYYLKDTGVMAVDEWVEDGRYYVDESGVCRGYNALNP